MSHTVAKNGQILHLPNNTLLPYEVVYPIEQAEAEATDLRWIGFCINQASSLANGDLAVTAQIFEDIRNSRQHSHWNWGRKIALSSNPSPNGMCYQAFALRVIGEIEALMLIKYPHSSRLRAGINLVYIDYLQTAPWNETNQYWSKKYRGCGSIMLATASKFKDTLPAGYEYGLALHSLPQAEDFYRNTGLDDLGPDSQYQNLAYFEMNEHLALKVEV